MDIIYQYHFGFNLTGLKNIYFYNSGFFGDELEAGGYIQRFGFFAIFLAAINIFGGFLVTQRMLQMYKKKKKKVK